MELQARKQPHAQQELKPAVNNTENKEGRTGGGTGAELNKRNEERCERLKNESKLLLSKARQRQYESAGKELASNENCISIMYQELSSLWFCASLYFPNSPQ